MEDKKRALRPRPAIAPAVLHVNEAIIYLGTSRTGIYRLFNSGALPKTVVQGRTVVRKVDADEFLARCVETHGSQSSAEAA